LKCPRREGKGNVTITEFVYSRFAADARVSTEGFVLVKLERKI
jgi:hypothetical protein